MAAALPDAIDKFQILRPLGEGGMGRLYVARDPDLGELVAIKLLREGFDNEELRERFNREARSARGLRHPNIVTIFQTGTHLGQPFIVMEYIQGETLGGLIHHRVALSLDRKLELMDELCAGLQHAHKKQVIHRDIKPSNLMVDEEGVLRILDFGIARMGGEGMTRTGAVMGTLNYMAPEQLAGTVVDERADIFSAGAVFYELLTYQRAFPGEPPAILNRIFNQDPPPIDLLDAAVPASLAAVVNRCLRKDARERYSDFGAVREALKAVRRELAAEGADETLVSRPRAGDRSDRLRIRSENIQRHVDAARRAFESENDEAALDACNRALMLEPEHAEALEIEERVRTRLDRQQQVRRWIADANVEFARGDVTAASVLADRALSLNPGSPEAQALRAMVDEARRRMAEQQERRRAIDAALARAADALKAESFTAAHAGIDEALALDPANDDARVLREQVVAAQAAADAARRRGEAEAQAARAAMDQARERFASGDPESAIRMLERFQPAPLVADALAKLRAEFQQQQERRRLEDERRRQEEERRALEEAERARVEEERRKREAFAEQERLTRAALTVRAAVTRPADPVTARTVTIADRPVTPDRTPRHTPRSSARLQTVGIVLAVLATAGGAAVWRMSVADTPTAPVAPPPEPPVTDGNPMSGSGTVQPDAGKKEDAAGTAESGTPGSDSPDVEVARQLAALRAGAREAWRRGQRESALASLAGAFKLQSNDSETRTLLETFVGQAQQEAGNAAVAAQKAGAQTNALFASAQQRQTQANTLARSFALMPQAVRAYAEAADLFTRATAETLSAAKVEPPVRPGTPPPPPPLQVEQPVTSPAETRAAATQPAPEPPSNDKPSPSGPAPPLSGDRPPSPQTAPPPVASPPLTPSFEMAYGNQSGVLTAADGILLFKRSPSVAPTLTIPCTDMRRATIVRAALRIESREATFDLRPSQAAQLGQIMAFVLDTCLDRRKGKP